MPVATCSPSAANSRRICATTAAARCASTAANARRALEETVDVTSTTVSATAALTRANSRLRSDMPLERSHKRDVPGPLFWYLVQNLEIEYLVLRWSRIPGPRTRDRGLWTDSGLWTGEARRTKNQGL